jgi:hypothetical protein
VGRRPMTVRVTARSAPGAVAKTRIGGMSAPPAGGSTRSTRWRVALPRPARRLPEDIGRWRRRRAGHIWASTPPRTNRCRGLRAGPGLPGAGPGAQHVLVHRDRVPAVLAWQGAKSNAKSGIRLGACGHCAYEDRLDDQAVVAYRAAVARFRRMRMTSSCRCSGVNPARGAARTHRPRPRLHPRWRSCVPTRPSAPTASYFDLKK